MQPDDEDSQEPDYYNEDDETHIESINTFLSSQTKNRNLKIIPLF